MQILSAVAHELQKDRQATATVRLRKALLDPARPPVDSLLRRVLALFTEKSGLVFGSLHDDGLLNAEIHVLELKPSDFLPFTERAVHLLESEVNKQPLATGGFILFALVEHDLERFLLVAILKNTEGLSFDKFLEVVEVEHLDLSKLHVAARINLSSRALASSNDYVAIVRGRREQDLTKYFLSFLALEEIEDSLRSTRLLIVQLDNFVKQKELPPEEVARVRGRCHAYLADKESSGDRVYLDELSAHLVEEAPTEFLSFVNTSGASVGTAFRVDRKSLKRLVTYSGKDAEVQVQFTNGVLGSRVRYYEAQDKLEIQPVPPNLRRQLASRASESSDDGQ